MQKVFRYLFLSVLVVFLTGCSFTKKASENGVSGNNDVDVKIKAVLMSCQMMSLQIQNILL